MEDNYPRRLQEWKWYLRGQSLDGLILSRERLENWISDPVHNYGRSATARSDLEYDKKRLVEVDAELARRGLPQPYSGCARSGGVGARPLPTAVYWVCLPTAV